MSVSSINIFAWTASLALTGGLGAYGYKNIKYLQETPKPYSEEDTEGNARAKAALGGGEVVTVNKGYRLNYTKSVVPNYVDFNWTGKLAPPPPPPPPPGVPKEAPQIEIKDILEVIYFQVDTGDAGGSRVLVRYFGVLAQHETVELRVADTLPSPHNGIAVVGITAESIEFSFSKEGRDNETFFPGELNNGLIHVIPPDGKALEQEWEELVIGGAPPDTRPQDTIKINPTTYQLGLKDAEEFGNNYQSILTNDVRTKTHRDANGQPAGIEVSHVREGSIAARHGLETRDVVISINGHPVNSQQEAIQWAKDNQETYTVWTVIVERLGRTATMTYRSPDR